MSSVAFITAGFTKVLPGSWLQPGVGFDCGGGSVFVCHWQNIILQSKDGTLLLHDCHVDFFADWIGDCGNCAQR